MQQIHLTTVIHASQEVVFDLSRSINLHKISTAHTNEEAIAGTITGLIALNETVTWKAKHLFRDRTMTVKITQMKPFEFFEDTMQAGDFKSFRHEHHFKQIDNGTIMIDLLEFESPYGKLGEWTDRFFLQQYLQKLLIKRNHTIKQFAESGQWKNLPGMLPLLA
ncbi:MAG: SRPBCC family protein [Chitinophagaceae bacterium]